MNDRKLSAHFSFFDLTVTQDPQLQEANREDALAYMPTLGALAQLLEHFHQGGNLKILSGYRSSALNKKTPGSSSTSQHLMGQAADIIRPGQEVDELFAEIRSIVLREKLAFGQIIFEQAARDHGAARWVHVSLGPDFWKPERCGEILTMRAGEDGVPHYTLIEKIRPWEVA